MIPFNWEPPVVRLTAIGRNVDLFETGMKWAGREANARMEILPALIVANQNFPHPLHISEVASAAVTGVDSDMMPTAGHQHRQC